MPLARLLYASRATRPLDMGEMITLLARAREHNAGRHITGMLAFDRDRFLQAIEGGSEAVNDLYHRIVHDPRHHGLRLLAYAEVEEREFNDWSMAAIDIAGLGSGRRAATLLRFCTTGAFDPFAMSASTALRLLAAWRSDVMAQQPQAAARETATAASPRAG